MAIYALNVDLRDMMGENYDEVEFLTRDVILEDDSLVAEMIDLDMSEYYNPEDSEEEHEKEEFEVSDSMRDELDERLYPMMNLFYVLSYEPLKEDIKKLASITTQVIIVYLEKFDVYGIMLTGAGFDMGAHIELAYRILDKTSPFTNDSLVFLDKEQKELLFELREKQKDYK